MASDPVRSEWRFHWDSSQKKPGQDHLDGFGVGNGRVFSLEGTTFPLNTLHNTVGPKFVTANDFFGNTALVLSRGGKELPFTEEEIGHVRRAPINLTRAVAEGVELSTSDFVVPGIPVIIRSIAVRNIGDQSAEGFSVEGITYSDTLVDQDMLWQERGDATLAILSPQGLLNIRSEKVHESFKDRILMKAGPAHTLTRWDIAVPTLSPGDAAEFKVYLVFTDKPKADRKADVLRISEMLDQKSAAMWQSETENHWNEWFSQGAQIHLPDAKVQDLFDEVALAIKLQQEPEGGVSPLSRYEKSWLRDTIGPMRYYLALGRSSEALQMADYLYRSSIKLEHISNSYSNSIDLSDVSNVNPDLAWWQARPFMPGRTAIEAPSYLALQMDRYWKWTGDLAPLKDRYDFLRWSVLGQLPSLNSAGMFPMSGDETWRTDMVLESWRSAWDFARHGDKNRLSVESHFLLTAAAKTVGRVSTALGKNEDAAEFSKIAADSRANADKNFWFTEKGYYTPFFIQGAESLYRAPSPLAHVQLMGLWSGFFDLTNLVESYHARSNLAATLSLLNQHEDSVPNTHSFLGTFGEIYTGMEPGLLLWNLTEMDHPLSNTAFEHLVDTATDSGNYFEFYRRNSNGSARLINDPYGRIGNATSLYRPWEGGMNMEAAFYYLFGIEPNVPEGKVSIAPHLPARGEKQWTKIAVDHVSLGKGTLDLSFEETGAGLFLVLEPKDLALDAELRIPAGFEPKEVLLNGKSTEFKMTIPWNVTSEGRGRIVEFRTSVPLASQRIQIEVLR